MRKLFLLTIGLMLTSTLMAGPVGKDEAQSKALAFLNGKAGKREGVAKAPRNQQDLSLATSGEAYHVFNIGAGDGFVIVSGSDLTPDILGYTDKGTFDVQNIPDNLRTWLQGYAEQIERVESQGVTTVQSKLKKAPAIKAPIFPLIQTKWDQDLPYSLKLPYCTPKSEYCATGCVATAMAQVLYYQYQNAASTGYYPVATTKVIPSYEYDIDGTSWGSKQIMPATPVTTFAWDKMNLAYTGEEKLSDPDGAAAAVADLMLCCGASLQMDYYTTSSASTMDVAQALKDYFGYDQHIKGVYRPQYTAAEWENLLYDELAAGRPVIYSGRSTGGGHSFICDGYDNDGYFHFNWGWSGDGDGFYLLSVLNPNETGTGSGDSFDGYTMRQSAVIGIQKPTGYVLPEADDANLTVTALKYTDKDKVDNSEGYFKYTVKYSFRAYSSYTHTYETNMGVYDESDNLIYAHHSYFDKEQEFEAGSYMDDWDTDYKVDLTELESGKTYKIKPVYRLKGSSDWIPFAGSDKYYIQAVKGATQTTFSTVNPTVNLTASDVKLITDGLVNTVQTITAKVKNNSADAYHGNIYLYKGSVKYAAVGLNLEAGESTMVSFSFKPYVAGAYEIWSVKTDDKTIGSGTITIKSGISGTDAPELSFDATLNAVYDGGTMKYLGTKAKGTVTAENSTGSNYVGWVALIYWYDGYKKGIGDFKELAVPAGGKTSIDFEYDLDPTELYQVDVQYYHNGVPELGAEITTPFCPVADAVTIMKPDGTAYEELAKSTYVVPDKAAVVDLRGLSGVVTALNTTSANPNCLYLADTDPISGITKNWVKGTTADNIVLTDGCDFYTPIDFTATNISYTRTFTTGASLTGGGWNTICLPFDVASVEKEGGTAIDWFKSKSDTDKNFWLYRFVSDGKGEVNFDYASTIKANTPYIINMPNEAWGAEQLTEQPITFKGVNAEILANLTNTQSGFYYMFSGGSQAQEVTNAYVLNDEGTNFAKTTGSKTVPAFQAYFYPSSHNLQANALAIKFVNTNKATGIMEVTNVEEAADDAWYTINGVKLTGQPTEKGVYIYQGKKVTIK